jgi:hypothetical protein
VGALDFSANDLLPAQEADRLLGRLILLDQGLRIWERRHPGGCRQDAGVPGRCASPVDNATPPAIADT